MSTTWSATPLRLLTSAIVNKLLASRPALQILFSSHQPVVLVPVCIKMQKFTFPIPNSLSLQSRSITNGFTTIRMPHDRIPRLMHLLLDLIKYLGTPSPSLDFPQRLNHGSKSRPRGSHTMIGTDPGKVQSPHASHHRCTQVVGSDPVG